MENNRTSPENKVNNGSKPVETDSAEIVRRHMQDKNHEITDDEIRNVKVTTTDEAPVTLNEATEGVLGDDSGELTEDESNDVTGAPDPKDKAGTPWDVIGE